MGILDFHFSKKTPQNKNTFSNDISFLLILKHRSDGFFKCTAKKTQKYLSEKQKREVHAFALLYRVCKGDLGFLIFDLGFLIYVDRSKKQEARSKKQEARSTI